MKSIDRLDSAISRQTDLDPINLRDDVIAQFFDDKTDIIGDILKHEASPETLGNILIGLLRETIQEVVREAEQSQELDVRQERAENLSAHR